MIKVKCIKIPEGNKNYIIDKTYDLHIDINSKEPYVPCEEYYNNGLEYGINLSYAPGCFEYVGSDGTIDKDTLEKLKKNIHELSDETINLNVDIVNKLINTIEHLQKEVISIYNL